MQFEETVKSKIIKKSKRNKTYRKTIQKEEKENKPEPNTPDELLYFLSEPSQCDLVDYLDEKDNEIIFEMTKSIFEKYGIEFTIEKINGLYIFFSSFAKGDLKTLKYFFYKTMPHYKNQVETILWSRYEYYINFESGNLPYNTTKFLLSKNLTEPLDEAQKSDRRRHMKDKWYIDEPIPSVRIKVAMKIKSFCYHNLGKKLLEIWYDPNCVGGINAKNQLCIFFNKFQK